MSKPGVLGNTLLEKPKPSSASPQHLGCLADPAEALGQGSGWGRPLPLQVPGERRSGKVRVYRWSLGAIVLAASVPEPQCGNPAYRLLFHFQGFAPVLLSGSHPLGHPEPSAHQDDPPHIPRGQEPLHLLLTLQKLVLASQPVRAAGPNAQDPDDTPWASY